MKNLKLIQIAFWLFMIGTVIQAQETVSTTGGNSSGSDGTVSYTIGQMFFLPITSNEGTIDQGVQQPYEIYVFTEIKENKGISLNYSAYPNPTTNFVVLKVENFNLEKLNYQLYDISGKLLQQSEVKDAETSISMENLTPSIYFLTVRDNHNEVKTFKIIKN